MLTRDIFAKLEKLKKERLELHGALEMLTDEAFDVYSAPYQLLKKAYETKDKEVKNFELIEWSEK